MRLLAGLALLCLVGCGASAPTIARNAVTAVDQIQIAGMKSFLDYNHQQERALLDEHLPTDAIRAALAGFIKGRDRVADAFLALADASHFAKTAIDAFDAGTARNVDWLGLLQGILTAGRALKEAADAIGAPIAGLDNLLKIAGGGP